MNKNEIISMISIDFILSNEEAGKVIDIIFRTMKDCFKKNKNLYIPEFGKFTVITKISSEGKKYKSIKFIPVKKLAKKLNYNFDNLKIVNIRNDRSNFANNDEFDYKMSDEVIK